MTPYAAENLDRGAPGPRDHRQRHPPREPRGDGGARARASADELPRGASASLLLAAQAQRRRRRHARQDDDVRADGARARRRGHGSVLPRRRRHAELRRQLPLRQGAVLRRRGRRVRHGVLRQGAQVPALPRRARRSSPASSSITPTSIATWRTTSRRSRSSSPSRSRPTARSSSARRYPNAVRDRARARRRAWSTYAPTSTAADYTARDLRFDAEGAHFVVASRGGSEAQLLLPMSGRHNVENALGVYAAARSLGLTHDESRPASRRSRA